LAVQPNDQMISCDDKELTVSRRFPRTVRLRAEYYEFVDEPERFLQQLAEQKVPADLFTFLQRPGDPTPRFPYPHEFDHIAVLRIDTYEKWWKQQINDKTRNMVRKASKKGVTIRCSEFNDELVKGIQTIYNESPIRQGKRFRHYGKDIETLRREHATFLDRSSFIGAYFDGQLIGFIKLVHQGDTSNLMQVLSLISQRDKSPTNALIAKAVEICAERRCPYLQYGTWSRRSFGDFKLHHGFERMEVPRYFVPLSLVGRCALRLRLHRELAAYIPRSCLDVFASLRAKWYARHWPGVAQ